MTRPRLFRIGARKQRIKQNLNIRVVAYESFNLWIFVSWFNHVESTTTQSPVIECCLSHVLFANHIGKKTSQSSELVARLSSATLLLRTAGYANHLGVKTRSTQCGTPPLFVCWVVFHACVAERGDVRACTSHKSVLGKNAGCQSCQ